MAANLTKTDIIQLLLLNGFALPNNPKHSMREADMNKILLVKASCLTNDEWTPLPRKIKANKHYLLREIQQKHHERYGVQCWMERSTKIDVKYMVDYLFSLDPLNKIFFGNVNYIPLTRRRLKKDRKTPLRQAYNQPVIVPTNYMEDAKSLFNSEYSLFTIPLDFSREEWYAAELGKAQKRLAITKVVQAISDLIKLLQ